MHFFEFPNLNSAIFEKPDENCPACWAVVQGSVLTSSIYAIKIHSGAKLNFRAFGRHSVTLLPIRLVR